MSRLTRSPTVRGTFAALSLGLLLAAPGVQAGIFDDDEARRAILDLRQKIELGNEQQRVRLGEVRAEVMAAMTAAMTEQMAALTEQMTQIKRSLLDLNSQLEPLRADNAKLRGQGEQLARDLAELQRKQRDVQSVADERMRKIEPQKVTLDGKDFNVEPEEKRQYDEAMELLRKSDFAATASALTAFTKRYPGSGYGDSALFWLGNSQYGARQYKEAIQSFRALVTASPENPKAAEALLAIANCQAELKDPKSARRTIEELVKAYPKSEAAQAGRERLASLK